MTDYTASLFAGDAPRSNRFGDTDDILMFTARAGAGSWFSGQVPGFIISGIPGDTAPVVITSQLAEIAVFARPIKSPATAAALSFDDFDANQFPDGFRLHYRVLLIRPDLNTVGAGFQRTLPFQRRSCQPRKLPRRWPPISPVATYRCIEFTMAIRLSLI